MRVRARSIPEDGMTALGRSDGANAPARPRTANALGRLVEIMRRNEDLLLRVESFRKRLARARAYAAEPLSDGTLATVLLEHTRSGYSTVLGELRDNRVEALAILRVCGHAEAICQASNCI
jgi:hypothetical protein